jgi:predicted transcriptional regulator
MGNVATRDMDVDQIERQIERCRRLASVMVDDDARHALEKLAEEYEAKLPRRRSFMLGQDVTDSVGRNR